MKEGSGPIRRIAEKLTPRTVLDADTIEQNNGKVHLQPGDRVTVKILVNEQLERHRITLNGEYDAQFRNVYRAPTNIYPVALFRLTSPDVEKEKAVLEETMAKDYHIPDLDASTPEERQRVKDAPIELVVNRLGVELAEDTLKHNFLEQEPGVRTQNSPEDIKTILIYSPVSKYIDIQRFGKKD